MSLGTQFRSASHASQENRLISSDGQNANGHSPVAPSLKKQPADLTHIALENGKFPVYRVEQTITGEQMTGVHGTREMPVWGSILRRKGGEGLMKLEIYNLTRYFETIQRSSVLCQFTSSSK